MARLGIGYRVLTWTMFIGYKGMWKWLVDLWDLFPVVPVQ